MRRELSLFYRQLAMSYRAGVPLADGLAMAAGACRRPTLVRAVADVLRRVRAGNPLGPALAAHPEAFQDVEAALVAVGDENGRLDDVLVRLADRSEKAYHDLRRLVLALLYPGFLFVAALFLPKLHVWVTTSFAAYLGEVFRTAVPFLLVLGLIAAGIVAFWRSSPEPLDRLRVTLPFLGPSLKKLALARFSDSLALLYAGGVPLHRSLRLAIGSMGNRWLERRCGAIPSRVERGSTIAESLGAAGVFPRELVDMVAIGERTGDLDGALQRMARLYEEEAERAIKALLILLPVAIYLLVALYIAIVVIGFFTGYFRALGGI